MKHILLSLLFILIAPSAFATTDNQSEEKSGIIQATYQGSIIEFPLLKSHYYVDIQGDLATVHLEQWFENPTSTPLNATYLFPLNKDAAVYAMQMKVGDETIEATIKRKEEAEKAFKQAKQEGKAASLLKQYRPNVFTQNLANLMPGKPIRVTLKYSQQVPRIDKQYELVLPLVVGPRYQPAQQLTTEEFDHIPTVHRSNLGHWELEEMIPSTPITGINLPETLSHERVQITVRINGGMPINAVSSATHALSIKQPDTHLREIELASGKTIDNRDFILHYSLAGDSVQAGFLNHEDERGNFFSLLIEPPAAPTDSQITAREMVFVLDTSGSMNGQPLDASKVFMKHAIANLRPTDTFRIIDFGNSPREFSYQPLQANAENKRNGLNHVEQLTASGGTEIALAVKQAFASKPTNNNMRIVVFLTDGYIGDESTVLATINELRGEARIYALGVGSSVNRYLLDEMGKAGHGFTRYIDPSASEARTEDSAIQFANHLQTPVMTNIQIDWGDMQVSQLTPSAYPDLFVGDSLRILGKFNSAENPIIHITGDINGQRASRSVTLQTGKKQGDVHTQAIPYIWARQQIAERMRAYNMPTRLRDINKSNKELRKEITQLGLNYSLITQWTSFIAISNKVVNDHTTETKDSIVPLPQVAGVSESAYSSAQFAGSSAPEPAVTSGLLLVALILGFYGLRQRRYRYGQF